MEQLLVGTGIGVVALLLCNLVWLRVTRRVLWQRDVALNDLRAAREAEQIALMDAVHGHRRDAADVRQQLLQTRNKLHAVRGDLARVLSEMEGTMVKPLSRRVEVRGDTRRRSMPQGGRGWPPLVDRLYPLVPEPSEWSESEDHKTEIVRFRSDRADDSALPV